MPGIYGIISPSRRPIYVGLLELMSKSMIHERYHSYSNFISESAGFYGGFVYDNDTDLRSIVSGNGLSLYLSGEVFLSQIDKNILPIDKIKNVGDYINENYRTHGMRIFEKLSGWYSGFLVDHEKKHALVFNDRYGFDRIYYYRTPDEFYFASEAKALLNALPHLRTLNYLSLAEFLKFNCVFENRTLFSNISTVPHSSVCIFQKGFMIGIEQYFSPCEWESQDKLPYADYYETLKNTFNEVIKRYYYKSELVGLSLTGGLDSRVIFACMKDESNFQCYTFGGDHRETNDIKVAKQIINIYKKPYQCINLGSSFFNNFSQFATKTTYLSDGYHGVCGAHDAYFSALAREIAPIKLSGVFGSEIIRKRRMMGLVNFNTDIFDQGMGIYFSQADQHFNSLGLTQDSLSSVLFKELPLHEYGRLKVERNYLRVRAPYTDRDLVKVVYRAPENGRNSDVTQTQLLREYAAPLAELITNRGTGGSHTYVFRHLRRFAYWMFQKAEYIYLYTLPKALAPIDLLVCSTFPLEKYIGWHKFEHYRIWFRNRLSSYVKETLLDSQTLARPILNSRFTKYITEAHTTGKSNYFHEIERLITVELIHRLFVDK